MNKRVGQILREVREEKNLTVRDIARETNIAPKYIIALENEDYGQFPGEPFILGFLKTYADFLKLDTAQMINLYKGEKQEDSSLPLEELTKPTVKMFAVEVEKRKLVPLLIIIALCVGALVFSIVYDNSNNTTVVDETPQKVEDGNENPQPKPVSEIPKDITFIQQSVPENSSVPFTLTPEQGFSFSVSNQPCRVFIKSVKKIDGKNIAVIGFNIYPEKKVYTFESKVDELSILSYNNPDLVTLRREIKIKTQAVTEKSAKILVTLGEEKTSVSPKPMGDVPIQVMLYFLKPVYVEFVIDGQPGERGVVPGGDKKQLEASDRLELKVGDGGAVEIAVAGKEKIKLGRPGRPVKKTFTKVPSSFDSTQFVIKESGE